MNDHVVSGSRPFAFLQGLGEEGALVRITPVAPSAAQASGALGVLASDEQAGPALSAEALLARFATKVDLGTTKDDDLVLNQYAKPQFERLEERIRQQPKLLKQLAFASRGGTQPGISAIFSGGAGLGKALAARVLAVRLEKPLYRLELDKIISDPATTLKNISAAISLTSQCGGILLIENIDALLGDNSRDHSNRDVRILNAGLAQRLRNQSGIVLFTSAGNNFGAEFQDATTERINLPFPDAPMRLEIWKRVFPPDAPLGELPLDRIAHHEMTGAQIAAAAMRAASTAIAAGRPIGVDDIKAAVQAEHAKAGRMITARDFNY